MTFSLLRESWIPLLSHDDTLTFGSLRDALLRSAEWRGIGTSNPIEVLALYRLLLAICHRALGPGDLEQRATLLGDWPNQKLEDYLEHWAERFDLFHPEHPFLQVAGLGSATWEPPKSLEPKPLEPKPWMRLAPDRASGSERLLWDHSLHASPEAITPARAAVTLVAHLQFTPGGLTQALRSSGEQGPACGLLLTLPMGNTLQETLALSLVPQTPGDHEQDQASWEKAPPIIEDLKKKESAVRSPKGPADRYTWLSRALLLQPGTSVTHLFYGAGLAPADSPKPDPMAATVTGKKGPFPLKIREDRAMWRDFHALTVDESSVQPETIRTAAEIRSIQEDYDPITLLAGGLLPDQAKIVLWRLEERRVSPRLLAAQEDAAGIANKALKSAESAGVQLRKAVFALCSAWLQNGGERSSAKVDVSNLLNSTQVMAHYWAALEPEFWKLVDQLGQGQDSHQALEEWRETLEGVVRRRWKQAKDSLGADGRALAAAGRSSKALVRVFKVIAA